MKIRKKIAYFLILTLLMTSSMVVPYGVAFATPSALPGARSVTVNGDVYLGGNYVEIGIDNNGWFGASTAAPSGFHPVSRTNIGMVMDGDGFDVGEAVKSGDFFLPGGPVEGYGIGYKETSDGTAITRVNTNPSLNSSFNKNMTLVDLSSGDTLSAVHTVDDGKVKLEQKVSFQKDDIFMKIEVKLTNISDQTLYDVRYFRKLDPDQDKDLSGTYSTLNKVVENPTSGTKALVYAKGPVTGTPFFYAAFDSDARASVTSSSNPYGSAMYNVDGDALLTSEVSRDTHIAMTFAKGNLNAGESVNLVLYQSLDPDLTSSLDKIEDEVDVAKPELTALSIENGTLSPAFSSDVTDYSTILPVGTKTTKVTPTATSGAAITVNGTPVSSGSASGDINVSPGHNTIPVQVTSGSVVKAYTIDALVASNDLSSLSVGAGTLSPTFNPDTLNYTVNYPTSTASMTLTAVSVSSVAGIEIDNTTSNGSLTKAVALSVGSNVIPIKITAEDGSIKTYTVTAVVASDYLANLTLGSGTLSPVFNRDTLNYEVNYPVMTTSTSITAVSEDPGSTVTINNVLATSNSAVTVALSVGDNSIPVKVTASDNSVRTYTIKANVASNHLSSLAVGKGELLPVFNENTMNYSVSYPYRTTSMAITAVPVTPEASVTINDTAVTSSSAVTVALMTGPNTIPVKVTAADSSVSTYTIVATVEKEDKNSGGGIITEPPSNGSEVIINGEISEAGKEKISQVGDEKILELVVDSETIDLMIDEALKKLAEEPLKADTMNKNIVKITTSSSDSDQIRVKLTGDIVKKLDDNQFMISLQTQKANYLLPAKEVNIAEIAKLFKKEGDLKKIVIDIQVDNVAQSILDNTDKLFANNGFMKMVTKPLSFKIIATSSDTNESVEVKQFKSYVEREIPVSIEDSSRITTGVLITEDGIYHVPTRIFKRDNENFVSIKSLTNSVYSTIFNEVSVTSVKGHWAEQQVNDMASRLVLSDYQNFAPDKKITRAEFADYITKALGLIENKGDTNFADVDVDNKYYKQIQVAKEYELFTGDEKGYFNPDKLITREEAVIVTAKALMLAGVQNNLDNQPVKFMDASDISPWAIDMVSFLQDKKVFNGNAQNELKPKDFLTCAEAATVVRNILMASDLIEK